MKTRTFLLALTLILPALTALQSLAQSVYEPYTFTTLAGETVDGIHGYPGYGSTDGTGTTARFANPYGVAVDSAGNIYVADTLNQTIRHVTSAGVVTTLAGQGYGAIGSEDGTGSAARFAYPWGVAVDSAGNVYVADNGNSTIRKVTRAGVVTTLAGLAGSIGSVDAKGSATRFKWPLGVAVDSAGNVYVADDGNSTIRKVTPAGVATTLAGLVGTPGSSDGTGTAARFGGANLYPGPTRLAVDSQGNVFAADTSNYTIRKVTPDGVVTTLAGLAGSPGSADGTGSAARFEFPFGVAVDTRGNVYVADSSTIRKITPEGAVTTLGGLAGSHGSADGTGSAARFGNTRWDGQMDVAVDSAGNVYVADTINNTIRKGIPAVGPPVILTQPQGKVVKGGDNHTFSVLVNGAAPMTYQWRKNGADIEGATNNSYNVLGVQLYDAGAYSVRASNGLGDLVSADAVLTPLVRPPEITTQPQSLTVAQGYDITFSVVATGTPLLAYQWRKDGVNLVGATNASYSIATIQTVHTGTYTVMVSNLYGTATSSNAGLTVTFPYTFITLAGNFGADGTGNAASFVFPQGVAVDRAGNVYVADSGNHTIRKVTPAGVVTTLAGLIQDTNGDGYFDDGYADGTGSDARFSYPSGVAVDSAGNLYVADNGNHTIRKVTPAGVVTTLAGLAGNPGSADGTGSDARFRFGQPNFRGDGGSGVAVDSAGNVYVADTGNDRIRKVTAAGVVTTLAGLADSGPGNADGTGSVAGFDRPSGVAVDFAGNVYVTGPWSRTIRKVTPAGVVTTLAGSMFIVGSADGTGSDAWFLFPLSVAVDSAGNVYVTDWWTIRKVTPAGVVTTLAGQGYGAPGSEDGTGSAARFGSSRPCSWNTCSIGPSGVAVDSAGNLYVADPGNGTIRKGYLAPFILHSGPGFGFNPDSSGFGFNLSGPAEQSVVVEASTDLVSWLPIWTNTFTGTVTFSDPQSGVISNRFYRARTP